MGLRSFLVANLTHPRGAGGPAAGIISRKDYLPNWLLFAGEGGSGDTCLGINIIFVSIATTARSEVAIVSRVEVKTQAALSDKTTAIRKQNPQNVSSFFALSFTSKDRDFSPVVLCVGEEGGHVEHDLVALEVGVHAVEAR